MVPVLLFWHGLCQQYENDKQPADIDLQARAPSGKIAR
jgi:hypothetical protein